MGLVWSCDRAQVAQEARALLEAAELARAEGGLLQDEEEHVRRQPEQREGVLRGWRVDVHGVHHAPGLRLDDGVRWFDESRLPSLAIMDDYFLPAGNKSLPKRAEAAPNGSDCARTRDALGRMRGRLLGV